MTVVEARRLRVAASDIQRMLDLPSLIRPATRNERDELLAIARSSANDCTEGIADYLEQLRADPDLTSDSLAGLPSLCFGWSIDQARNASGRRPRLIQQWMVDVLSPLPRPSSVRVAEVAAIVRQLSIEPGWPRTSAALADAWVDEHCSAISDHDDLADIAEAEVRRYERARAWPRLAKKAIDWPDSPFGVWTATAVGAKIEALFHA